MDIVGIPVSELLQKAEDPIGDLRLAVIRCGNAKSDTDCNLATEGIVARLKERFPSIQVKDVLLSKFRIRRGASNNPAEETFDPEDQFPSVLDVFKRANFVVVATTEALGFPDAGLVRLLERLSEQKTEDTPKPFDRKSAGILVVGGKFAALATSSVTSALLCLGFSIPATVGWNKDDGHITKSKEFGVCVDRLAQRLADQAPLAKKG